MHFSLAYATLALSGVYLSAVAAQSATSTCWASAAGVSANYATLEALHTDATSFCTQFGSGNGIAVVSSAGRETFGFQSAIFINRFANSTSCLSTFNTLVNDCYGTTSPTRPVSLGGVRVDPGGAELVISFGDGAKL